MITQLTEEQKSKFPEYVEKWTEIGLCTKPADRPLAEEGIREAYQVAGLSAPRVVWCQSPLSMCLTRFFLTSVQDSVWNSIGDSVWDSLRASGYGQHDAAWLGFYSFFRNELGLISQTQKLSGLWKIAASAGWFLPFSNICFISERHNVLHRDEEGRLHCATGPALSYPDGFSIYAIHGVRLDERIILRPETITVSEIDKESNAEIRRVMIAFRPGGKLPEARQ